MRYFSAAVAAVALFLHPIAATAQELQAQPTEAEPVAAPPETQAAAGQWIYTSQYGWVFAPYSDDYANATGPEPVQYLYLPAIGWGWAVAPWILGWGPQPFFGVHGYAYYPWYSRGYGGRWYFYRGAYATYPGRVGHYAGGSGGRFVDRRGPYRAPRPSAPARSSRPATPSRGYRGGGGHRR